MASDNLKDVRQRCRDIFKLRAPALWRFGEPILKVVDEVTNYAYRQGAHAHHLTEHGEKARGRVRGTLSDHRVLLGHLVTLVTSASGASAVAAATGPVVPPVIALGVVGLVAVGLFVKALMSGGD